MMEHFSRLWIIFYYSIEETRYLQRENQAKEKKRFWNQRHDYYQSHEIYNCYTNTKGKKIEVQCRVLKEPYIMGLVDMEVKMYDFSFTIEHTQQK
jgi:hypothetical protein